VNTPSISEVFSAFTDLTNHANAFGALDARAGIDRTSRSDFSNALLIVTKTSGQLRFGVKVGEYNVPVVGLAVNQTAQPGSNTNLFGMVPSAYLQYAFNDNVNLEIGKLETLVGSESLFTYQNLNIQRGLVLNMEPGVSRGLRLNYAKAKFSSALEFNDGFYSGRYGAIMGSVGWTPNDTSSVQLVVFRPSSNTPPNPTSTIANKSEYNLMVTYGIGKLQLLPYLLQVDSPRSTSLGYTARESAFGGAILAKYALNPQWSLAARYECVANRSTSGDTSLNADLLGFGPGSKAITWTLTPTYRFGNYFARGEATRVNVIDAARGVAFGPRGMLQNQNRLFFEVGIQY
jgi:hypothetical protein